jgi:ubiquinone/menaquinone biosynthesis C-methylase UbiE
MLFQDDKIIEYTIPQGIAMIPIRLSLNNQTKQLLNWRDLFRMTIAGFFAGLLICFTIQSPANAIVEATYKPCANPSPFGIGTCYMGREIAKIIGSSGSDWLDRPTREQEERPSKAIEALKFKSTDIVAEIGAGTGYFSLRIAPQVAKVYSVELQPEFIDILRSHQTDEQITNIEIIQGQLDRANLPEKTLDYAVMVDAYHEFSQPREMMQSIFSALKPGGKAVLIEYKGESASIPIKPLHKMTQTQARGELAAIGFDWVENKRILPQQHVLIFRKPKI